MPFKEAAQNVVQQLARVDRLKIERGLATWLEPQHPLRKEAIRAVAINAEAARAVHEARPKLLFQQIEQMRIGDHAVVWTKLETAALAFNLDSSQRGVADEAIVAGKREQTRDPRQRQQFFFHDRVAM